MKPFNKKGFTLVEVMVVMAVIAVLSVLIIGAITIARKQAMYSQARSEMREIRGLMEIYILKFGELPPTGDCCPRCYNGDPVGQADWNRAINAMRDANMLTQEIATNYYTDPWGTYYAYDDNLGQGLGNTLSQLCTFGPDRVIGNGGVGGAGVGDDECMNIIHEAKALASFGL